MISSEEIVGAVRPRLRRYIADTGDVELIKRYTACEYPTIGGWLAKGMPMAEKLIIVWHMLDVMGYDSPEMSELDELQRYLGRVFALGVIDMQRLMELLDITNNQTAIQFLRGQSSMSLKSDVLPGLRQQFDDRLSEAAAKLPKVAVVQQQQPESTPAAKEGDVSIVVSQGMDPILLLATLIGAALPLARQLVESGTPEERSALRKAAGHPTLPTIFTLSAFIEALCSEEALRKLRGKA